jgi:hypothetical protein
LLDRKNLDGVDAVTNRTLRSPSAAVIAEFYETYFNRPCGVPEWVVSGTGKEKRVYPW